MRPVRVAIVLAGALLSLSALTGVIAQSSPSFDLSWTVLGSAGSRQTAGQLALDGTLGQTIAGPSSGALHLGSGYWYGVRGQPQPPGETPTPTPSDTREPGPRATVRPSGVHASSALEKWPIGLLIDGKSDSVWSSRMHKEHLAQAEWAAVILPRRTAIDGVGLYPRRDPSNPNISLGFPKDLVVQYSVSEGATTCDTEDVRFSQPGNWKPLITRYGFDQPPAEPVEFTFERQHAECIRVFGAELSQDDYGNRYLQLAEIEPRTGSSAVRPAAVKVSSTTGNWYAEKLIDNDPTSVWSSRTHKEHLSGAEWAAVMLPQRTRIDAVRLDPRQDPSNPDISLGFPKDFVIQYSISAGSTTCNATDERFTRPSNWKPLITRYGFDQPAHEPIRFAFAAQEVECLRVFGAELSQDDYGNRYLQLAGITPLTADMPIAAADVVVSSTTGNWHASKLIDDDPSSVWSSRTHKEHLQQAEWAVVTLPSLVAVDGMRVHPRQDPTNPETSLGFPKDLVLQYATNSGGSTCNWQDARFANPGNWKPLITRYGFDQPSSGPVQFDFPEQQAECLRFFGAELSQDDYGNRYLQLADIDAYRSP